MKQLIHQLRGELAGVEQFARQIAGELVRAWFYPDGSWGADAT